jgi:hypothetical protein
MTFKKGDVITAYHAGYWRVIKVIRRFYDEHDVKYGRGALGQEYSPLLQYEKIMNKNFTVPAKATLQECDASFCKVVDIAELTAEAVRVYNHTVEGLQKLEKLL